MTRTTMHIHDILIIGGGLTGLRAALRISDAGYDAAVISKVHPLRSHSVAAQGGMNAALGHVPGPDGEADTWENHAYDTVKGSDYLADQDAVARMCQEAPFAIFELEEMGMVWSRLADGRIAQRPFGGAGFPRACYAADRTGHNALHTLYQHVLTRGIAVYEDFFVTALVHNDGRCTGCTALEIMEGTVHGFGARAILLATGGFGRVYHRSTNALINTGDGQALALRAGVPLRDMEFVQFHPTTLVGTNILITEGARGEGGILLNSHGERFMERYAPHSLDLAPRDVIARAIEQEIAAGRGFPGGYVHLDLTGLGASRITERLPGIQQIAMDFAGIDPGRDPVPVQPGQHYSMGGIAVTKSGATTLTGLYAAGECACISVHGANRLGGNSLLETVVFGRLAADTIITDLPTIPPPVMDRVAIAAEDADAEIERILRQNGQERLPAVRDAMKMVMSERFGIFREGRSMEEGIQELIRLKERYSGVTLQNKDRAANQVLVRYLELGYMLDIALVVARSAKEREESRGAHTRTDHPGRDDTRFLQHTLANLGEHGLIITYTPVVLGMFSPEERVY